MTTIVTFELNELPLISWKNRGLVLCIQPLYHALQAYQRTIGWHSISKSLRPSPPNDFLYQFRPIQYLGSLKTFSLNLERAKHPLFYSCNTPVASNRYSCLPLPPLKNSQLN